MDRVTFGDDHAKVVARVERQLGHAYERVVARSGAMACSSAMPNAGGVTLLAQIRKPAPHVVPLMVTAHAKPEVPSASCTGRRCSVSCARPPSRPHWTALGWCRADDGER